MCLRGHGRVRVPWYLHGGQRTTSRSRVKISLDRLKHKTQEHKNSKSPCLLFLQTCDVTHVTKPLTSVGVWLVPCWSWGPRPWPWHRYSQSHRTWKAAVVAVSLWELDRSRGALETSSHPISIPAFAERVKNKTTQNDHIPPSDSFWFWWLLRA